MEAALAAATTTHDLSVMERLLSVLATPYDHDRNVQMFSAPSPRRYLEHTRDYLGLDLDLAGLTAR